MVLAQFIDPGGPLQGTLEGSFLALLGIGAFWSAVAMAVPLALALQVRAGKRMRLARLLSLLAMVLGLAALSFDLLLVLVILGLPPSLRWEALTPAIAALIVSGPALFVGAVLVRRSSRATESGDSAG